jgi:nitrogen regulatory protein PII 2
LGQTGRLIPKRTLLMVVPDKAVDKAVKTIIATNQTGKSGDGRIFVVPCGDAVRVRTGESGDAVLDEVE